MASLFSVVFLKKNNAICPESLGAILECWCIECGLFPTDGRREKLNFSDKFLIWYLRAQNSLHLILTATSFCEKYRKGKKLIGCRVFAYRKRHRNVEKSWCTSYLRVFVTKKNAKLLKRFCSCLPWKLQQAAESWKQRRNKFRPTAHKIHLFPLWIVSANFVTETILHARVQAQFLTSQGAGK